MISRIVTFLVLISILLCSSSFVSCNDDGNTDRFSWPGWTRWWWWYHHHRPHNYQGHPPPAPPQGPSPSLPPPSKPSPHNSSEKIVPQPPARNSPTFNVLNFGARGDGKTDDTKAFQSAWQAACKVEGSMVLVPARYEFLVGTIYFDGLHCKGNILFQLDGTIVAPPNRASWGEDLSNWMVFQWSTGLTVQGQGTIEGRGSGWWGASESDDHGDMSGDDQKSLMTLLQHEDEDDDNELGQPQGMPTSTSNWRFRPTALRFYRCKNVKLIGIKIQNSPNVHLKIMNCKGVTVHDFNVSAPGDSPNTDAIQVHRSRDVEIYNSRLACGDDCVAIEKGCQNVSVHDVECGPGHGISIGSLGEDNSMACVFNITVRHINIHNAMNGARIKTWQGGKGSVHGVTFSDIQMTRVKYPIIVDQYYCDRDRDCKNQSSAVAVTGITYENIRGTYTARGILFGCSDSLPCTDISMSGVDLKPAPRMASRKNHVHRQEPLCWQVFGEWTDPPASLTGCVQPGKPPSYDDRVRPIINMCRSLPS